MTLTHEESQLPKKISQDLIDIKLAFSRFTEEKKQHWKDEAARKREATW